MKCFIVFAVLVVAAVADQSQYCYSDVVNACNPSKKQAPIKCNAKYGGIENVLDDLQTYALHHISRSHEYLLMSTHYANVEKNRVGFEKLFRGLSDEKWHNAIEIIKYITKRGGVMDFTRFKDFGEGLNGAYELYELQSIALSLDVEKKLALAANKIHKEATNRAIEDHDPEISSYIEEEFSHKQAHNIRKLSGYAADLGKMLNGTDGSLALYLFDEYLQKQ